MRLAPGEVLKLDHGQGILDPIPDFLLWPFLHFQAIGHVVEDRHVRKQRVVLEDRVQRPVFRRGVSQVLIAQRDGAVIRMLETRHHPQQGGLAATGRSQEGNELASKMSRFSESSTFCRRTVW